MVLDSALQPGFPLNQEKAPPAALPRDGRGIITFQVCQPNCCLEVLPRLSLAGYTKRQVCYRPRIPGPRPRSLVHRARDEFLAAFLILEFGDQAVVGDWLAAA